MTTLAPYVVFSLMVLEMLFATLWILMAFLIKPPTPRGAFRFKHLFQNRDLLERTRTEMLIEGSLGIFCGIAFIVLMLHAYLRNDHARPTRCSDHLPASTTTSASPHSA